jgi:hypothetical protein
LNAGNNSQVAISTNGTGTTEMYFDQRGTATGIWRFRDTADTRMSLTSVGLGIGEDSPTYKLVVSPSDNDGVLISSSNDAHTGYLYFGDVSSNTAGAVSYDHSNNSMRFNTGGGEQMRIDSSGNVGIGTSNPAANLEVSKEVVGGTADMKVVNSATTDAASGTRGIISVVNAVVGDPRLVLAITGVKEYSLGIDNSDSDKFKINDGSDPSSGTNYLTIDSGNVGIGTDAPTVPLDVVGATSLEQFRVGNTTGGTDFGITVIENDAVVFNSAEGATARDLVIQLGGTERARFTANGLTFNGDTTAANALDDYEEGTWTPTTATAGYTISSSSGKYTKIGRQVTIQGKVTFSAVDGSSNSTVQLTSNPFTASDVFTGLVREDTSTGAVYVASINAANNVEINSMDGIATTSQRPIAISENYVFTLTYFV